MSRITRRRLLQHSASALVAAPILTALAACSRQGIPLDSENARRIGARHAAAYPDATAQLWRGRPPRSDAEWASRIEALCREDLEADRLVQVDGWWLAETELRLCVVLHELG